MKYEKLQICVLQIGVYLSALTEDEGTGSTKIMWITKGSTF